MRIRIPFDMKIDDAITLMQETAQELRRDPMMRHYIWSPLEMQGVQGFEDGCPILRMRFRTAPEMQWDVSRAFNLLLKQRMEAQEIDLGVPRLSVSMEARAEDRMEATAGTSFSLEEGSQEQAGQENTSPESEQGKHSATQASDFNPQEHKKPTPPKPAPRPTKAEIRQDEQARRHDNTNNRAASHRQKPQAQGKPQSDSYASPGGEHGDE